MAPNAPSPEMLVALSVAVVFVLFAALLLYVYSPLPSFLSLLTSPKKVPMAQSGPMAPALVPSPIHTTGFEAQNLLDLSSPEQFDFPILQPRVTRGAGLTAPNFAGGPIIREGSPIDLTTEPDNQRNTADESIQYRPANDHGIKDQAFEIHWALDHATVFDTHEEEVAAIRLPSTVFGRTLTENMFFQWGLRYVPPVATGDIYRSVLIEKLPQGVTLDQILPRIRGGQIYSASLCDTSPITKSWTALIVFVQEAGAFTFLRRVEQEGLYIGFAVVSVRRVPTPTYLFNSAMMQAIRSHRRTRCLVVGSSDPKLKATLHKILTNTGLGGQVECFGEKDPEGATSIRFHSIKAAMRAHEVLVDTKMFKLAVQFVADPCSL